jgi:hypothetical protein
MRVWSFHNWNIGWYLTEISGKCQSNADDRADIRLKFHKFQAYATVS